MHGLQDSLHVEIQTCLNRFSDIIKGPGGIAKKRKRYMRLARRCSDTASWLVGDLAIPSKPILCLLARFFYKNDNLTAGLKGFREILEAYPEFEREQ